VLGVAQAHRQKILQAKSQGELSVKIANHYIRKELGKEDLELLAKSLEKSFDR
jgi:hypothetical protein